MSLRDRSYCDPCRRGEHERCLTARPGESNWPDPECTCKGECVEDARATELKRAITEHRTAIRNAGTIVVRPGYEPVAAAKHRADERLWSVLDA